MIDTHAHLQDEKLSNLQAVINDAKNVGVNKIICASCCEESSLKAIHIANKFDGVYATIGVHPQEAELFNDGTLQNLSQMAKNKKVVAIGEIGLDYYYIKASKELQKEVFIKQIDLANKLNLPIVVHTRDATKDTMDILKANLSKLKNGVCIHCFNMSVEMLKIVNKLGFYISIGGIVTFKNANNVLNIVKECDINKLMLETDCPYLTPVPYRSKVNEPKYVVYSAQKMAEIRGMTLQEFDEITTQNAERFFKLQ